MNKTAYIVGTTLDQQLNLFCCSLFELWKEKLKYYMLHDLNSVITLGLGSNKKNWFNQGTVYFDDPKK